MNPELPPNPRAELEARVTAFLLGELPAHEAAAFRQEMDDDAQLAELCDHLKPAIKLLRESAANPETPPAAETTPLKLSDERRQKLLAHFKTIQPKEFVPAPQRKFSWLVPLAACLVILPLLAGLLLPALSKAKSKSVRVNVYSNLRQIELAKQMWAQDNNKSPNDAPTLEDLKSYGLPKPVSGETYVPGKVGEPAVADLDVSDAKKVFGRLPAEKQSSEVVGVAGVRGARGIREEIVRLDSEGKLAYVDHNANAPYTAADAAMDSEKAKLAARLAEQEDLTDRSIRRQANGIVGQNINANAVAPSPVARSAQQLTIVLPPVNQLADASSPVADNKQLGVGFSAEQPVSFGGAGGGGAGGGGGRIGGIGGLSNDKFEQQKIPIQYANAANVQNGLSDLNRQPRLSSNDPEWMATLNQPEQPHSSSNLFIASYGFIPPGGTSNLSHDFANFQPQTANIPPATGLPTAGSVPLLAAGSDASALNDQTKLRSSYSYSIKDYYSRPGSHLDQSHDLELLTAQSANNNNSTLTVTPPPTFSSDVSANTGRPAAGVSDGIDQFSAGKLVTESGQHSPERPAIVAPPVIPPQAAPALTGIYLGEANANPPAVLAPSLGRYAYVAPTAEKKPMLGAQFPSRARALKTAPGAIASDGESLTTTPRRPQMVTPISGSRSPVDQYQGIQLAQSQQGNGPVALDVPQAAIPLESRSKALVQNQNSPDSSRAFGGQTSGSVPAASLGPVAVLHYNSIKIDKKDELAREEQLLRDSKDLSPEQRMALQTRIGDLAEASRKSELESAEKLANVDKAWTKQAPQDDVAIRKPAATDQTEQTIAPGVIDFPAAPLGDVIEIYGRLTGRSIVTANLPPIAITFKNETPLTKDEAIQTLAAVLATNGITLENVGDKFLKVVPTTSAGGEPAAPAKIPAPAPEPQPEVLTSENAFSTFSLNVSDVSFKLAAASLEKGILPEPASIRSEEFINAFDYRDPEPAPGAPIGFTWERAQDPFAQNRELVRFSVKTAAAGREPGRPLNIVLLLDNSGSMERADRVQIIHEALRVLAGELQPQDKLSVVIFARTASLWVDGASGDQAGAVADAAGQLTPQGGTNLEEAMRLAYETARRHYLANGVNRVVLLTDGAANLGNVDPAALQLRVEENRKQGIALDCFGIGWEGYNDDLLEVLTRHGDGRYGFLNTPQEAATDFAGQLAGALHVAAADVKVQVEFNPARVTAYRQIGYAKHQLTKEQFRDNTVAAAQIGAAESGNGLYVVAVNPAGNGPLGVVRVRFKVPGTSEVQEHAWELSYTGNAVPLDQANPAMRLAATASGFAEWLSQIPYAAEITPDELLHYLNGVPQVYGADARPQKLEWMIRQAKSLSGK